MKGATGVDVAYLSARMITSVSTCHFPIGRKELPSCKWIFIIASVVNVFGFKLVFSSLIFSFLRLMGI